MSTLLEAVEGRVFTDHYHYLINPENEENFDFGGEHQLTERAPGWHVGVIPDAALIGSSTGVGWVALRLEVWSGEPKRQDGWAKCIEFDFVTHTGDIMPWGGLGDAPEWSGRGDAEVNLARDGPGTYRLRLYRNEVGLDAPGELQLIQSWRVG